MYIKAASSLILLMLIGYATADCSIGYDYCGNLTYSLNYPTYDASEAGAKYPYFALNFTDFTTNDAYIGQYIQDNLTNAQFTLYNTSDVWIKIYGVENKRMWFQTNYDNSTQTLMPTINVCINKTLGNNYPNYTTITEFCPGTCFFLQKYNLLKTDLTQYYTRNWTFKDESNVLFDFTGKTANLNIWCNNAGPFDINLTDRVGSGGSLIVQTSEKPLYTAEVDSYLTRIRQDAEHFLLDDYLLSSVNTSSQYSFLLSDYTTDQFKGSTLYIQRYVGDSIGNIHVQQFPNDNTIYAYLENNTQHKILLKNDYTTKDLGPLLIVDTDLTKDILIGEPTLYGLQNLWGGVSYAWIGDYNSSQVGATVTSPSSVTATFTVKNASASPYVTTYSTSGTGTSLTFTYTTPNRGTSMMLYLDIVNSAGQTYSFRRLVQLADSTAPLNTTAFNPQIPDNMMGSSTETVKKLFGTLISLFVLFTVAKASKPGIGAVMAVVTYSFFWYVNYIPHSQVPWFILPILGLLAFSLAFFERRT